MKPNRIPALLAAALLVAAPCALAQSEPAKDHEKKAAAKKVEKKAAAKKVEKKDSKKTAAKPAPKKTTPPAKQVKKDEKVLGPGTYSTGPATLRDKDGNVIPTSPDAYNVDSAVKKK